MAGPLCPGLAGGDAAAFVKGEIFSHCTLPTFWNEPVRRNPMKPSGRFPICAVRSMMVRNFSELRSKLSLSLKRT